MPLETNLSQSPYFDDYNQDKQFYKVLFQPSVSVQVRELNQLQSILQKQVERFGDNVFKRGTIIDGCNFSFNKSISYIKLLDVQPDQNAVIPSTYVGYIIENNSTELRAKIVNYYNGFESNDPDLKTLYLSYINSGANSTTYSFSSGDTLTIYSEDRAVFSANIVNGGTGFSSGDSLVVTPALIINTSSAFANGDFLNDGSSANVEVVSVDTTTLSSLGQVIVSYKPIANDLANATASSLKWTFSNGASVADSTNAKTGTIVGIVGSGLDGTIKTNSIGKITEIVVTSRGSGYTVAPQLTVKSPNNSTGIAALDLVAKNYAAQVTVASTTNAVGNGYSFTVTDGIIYQKGYFLNVQPQTIIVEKYSTSPNNVAVGFGSVESIVTSDVDQSLLDNALGTENETAPGADRLKIVPTLKVVEKPVADTDVEFFTLVEWAEGRPYKQNTTTQYNKINDELAKRTRESSGDFVTDRFLLNLRTVANSAQTASKFTVQVDPGTAYIAGYRVNTVETFSQDVNTGTDVLQATTQSISLNYENYILVREVGGIFQFSTGDTIDLYDTAKTFISNTTALTTGNTTPVGTKIGTARIRSFVKADSTIPDTSLNSNKTQYKLYLFDITMNAGKNFKNVKSVYYNGTYKGIADTVLTTDPTTQANVNLLYGNTGSLTFSSGVESMVNATNINYIYRTIDQTTSTSNNGLLVKNISATPNETFPYSGNLTASQLRELYVVPLANNLIAANDVTGNVSTTATSNVVTGSGTTFLTDLQVGDFVYVYANSSGGHDIKQVTQIANDTSLRVESNISFSNTSGNLRRVFPQYVPVPFGIRSGLSANVDANANILTLNFGTDFTTTTSVNTAIAVNIKANESNRKTKVVNRNKFVKIQLSNNTGNTVGPWCLGVPNITRLRNVYIANTTNVNTSSNNVTSRFYCDHNQTQNYYGLGYLYLNGKTNISLTSSDFLLCEFDYITESAGGFADPISYLSANVETRLTNDSLPLANLTTTPHSFEVGYYVNDAGSQVNLLSVFDYRPMAANTVNPTSAAASAPINPSATVSFGNTANPANDKKFPLPDSTLSANVSQFAGRIDAVFITANSDLVVLNGQAEADRSKYKAPSVPYQKTVHGLVQNTVKLNDVIIPPYPNLLRTINKQTEEILRTNCINISNPIYIDRQISIPTSASTIADKQPKAYTMAEIGNLERRISDLEYYVSLSVLETDIKNRVIESSVDPQLDRFKFGFIVDDFSSEIYSDVENPTYAASIEADDALPPQMNFIGEFNQQDVEVNIHVLYPIVTQINATVPSLIEPPCIPDTQTANTFAYGDQFASFQVGNTISSYAENYYFTMASGNSNTQFATVTTAPATLYFYAYDKDIKIEVYQGNTLIANTASATALTAAEKTLVTSNEASKWFDDQFSLYGVNPVVNGTYAKYMGKIRFNHRPASGRDYTIKILKGSGSYRWKYILEYPIDRSQVGCPPPPPPIEYNSWDYSGYSASDSGSGCASSGGGGDCY